VATGPVPGGKAGAKLCDPFRLLTEADQSETPAYDRLRNPLRQRMLPREVDCRVGACLRRSKLASEAVQERGEF
jgi:hypothetical protein